jgi:hypothetical protein
MVDHDGSCIICIRRSLEFFDTSVEAKWRTSLGAWAQWSTVARRYGGRCGFPVDSCGGGQFCKGVWMWYKECVVFGPMRCSNDWVDWKILPTRPVYLYSVSQCITHFRLLVFRQDGLVNVLRLNLTTRQLGEVAASRRPRSWWTARSRRWDPNFSRDN